jgi:hypothetical protein
VIRREVSWYVQGKRDPILVAVTQDATGWCRALPPLLCGIYGEKLGPGVITGCAGGKTYLSA